MAGRDRMTIEEVAGRCCASDRGVRQSVARELMEEEVGGPRGAVGSAGVRDTSPLGRRSGLRKLWAV